MGALDEGFSTPLEPMDKVVTDAKRRVLVDANANRADLADVPAASLGSVRRFATQRHLSQSETDVTGHAPREAVQERDGSGIPGDCVSERGSRGSELGLFEASLGAETRDFVDVTPPDPDGETQGGASPGVSPAKSQRFGDAGTGGGSLSPTRFDPLDLSYQVAGLPSCG